MFELVKIGHSGTKLRNDHIKNRKATIFRFFIRPLTMHEYISAIPSSSRELISRIITDMRMTRPSNKCFIWLNIVGHSGTKLRNDYI